MADTFDHNESIWEEINSHRSNDIFAHIIDSNHDSIQLSLAIDGFYLHPNFSGSFVVESEAANNLLIQGAPDLPRYVSSIVIPEGTHSSVSVINSDQYVDYNYAISPSRGNVLRDQLLENVDYTKDEAIYSIDAFFPGNLVELSDIYQLGGLTGQDIITYPYQYNPVTETLRVYANLDFEVSWDTTRSHETSPVAVSETMDVLYDNHFINYTRNENTEVTPGNLLIIVANGFADHIEELADWKVQKGLATEIFTLEEALLVVETFALEETGASDAVKLQAFMQFQQTTNGIDFLLLIGNVKSGSAAEEFSGDEYIIPSPIRTDFGENDSADMSYAFMDDDYYPDFSVGRLTADNLTELNGQIARILDYEKNPMGSWYEHALSIASTQGSSYGFQEHADNEFNQQILWPILNNNEIYSSYVGLYDSGLYYFDGVTQTYIDEYTQTNQSVDHVDYATNLINNYGIGLINYTGHGNWQGWANGAPFKSNDVNNLDNTGLFPFIITVGCEVGDSSYSADSFSATWLEATNEFGQPIGAIGHFGSTILQGWAPPMYGQVGMNCLIAQATNGDATELDYCTGDYLSGLNPIHTLGGITTQGTAYMNSEMGDAGYRETTFWTLFGDPSLELRTAESTSFEVSVCDTTIEEFIQQVTIKAEANTWVTLSQSNTDEIDTLIHTAYIDNDDGIVQLDLSHLNLTADELLTLTVTGPNKTPYQIEEFTIRSFSDLNGDNHTNILDLIILTNRTLDTDNSRSSPYGDVNCDGEIDVLDIIKTVSIIIDTNYEDDSLII